jgi:putative GTP pyrophosphokinase
MQPQQHRRFLADYEQYVRTVLMPTNEEIRSLFSTWRDPEHWALAPRLSRLPSPSPVQRTHTRIKRPESVVDKILRHPSLFPDGLAIESVKRMNDAVGGRVVVYFLANLPFIDKSLRSSDDLEVSSSTPPVAYLTQELVQRLGLTDIKRGHKDSGYASIHYVVRLRNSAVQAEDRPWFELQVRTLAEDVWGEIEHILGYKPNKKTSFAVRKQFQIISAELTAIDEHFNLLYEELSRFQEESIYRDESPLNAENIPAVLSEMGIGCAQREIDGLLKLLVSRGIETVGELRSGATQQRVEAIRAIYRACEGRVPNNFEIVASVAAIRGLREANGIEQAVKSQIDFLKAWEKLKKDLT